MPFNCLILHFTAEKTEAQPGERGGARGEEERSEGEGHRRSEGEGRREGRREWEGKREGEGRKGPFWFADVGSENGWESRFGGFQPSSSFLLFHQLSSKQ